MQLSQLLAERIVSGLRRKSIQNPSRWAEEYRVMGKPYPGKWTFAHHPWLREMHDSKAPSNVGKKSAQMGYTEWALNLTFYKIDVEGENCLYILPNKVPDASEFSASRFDPALELSEHLSKLFSDVQNVGHKRAGSANLYIRGSQSRSGLKSVPAGFLIFDELDEMNQENIVLAHERQSGQVTKQDLKISTPTVPNFGIDKFFNDSTREHFFFPCPLCSKATELIFPECLVVTAEDYLDERVQDSHMICKECKGRLDNKDFLKDGYWVPQFPGREVRGFYINQLYSSTISAPALAKTFLMSLRDKSTEQEFYNSKLGIAHVVDGARVNDDELEKVIGEYKRLDSKSNGLITMGTDVGSWLHNTIVEWDIKPGAPSSDINMYARARLIWFGKVRDFGQLDQLMRQYNVTFGVIDAQPEKRSSFAFANRFWGKVKICYYGNSISGKTITSTENNDQAITVDRTAWLDMSLGRFHIGKKAIIVPTDIDVEFRDHMKSLVRRYEKDANGNQVGRYVETGPDHYAHALNYAEIALPFAVGTGRVETIGQRVL